MNKKPYTLLLVTSLALSGYAAFGQTQTNTVYIDSPNGYNVGIGLTNTYSANYSHSYLGLNISRNNGTGNWKLGTDGANNGGGLILGSIIGELKFYTFPVSNPSSPQTFTDSQIGSAPVRMIIAPSGQVQIGTTQPTTQPGYLLSVAGKIVSQSVYITAPNTWADFVFEPTYKPMALPALETYLRQNKHLPYIPSAIDVEANGYSVTEMDAKLLRTVEELTLQVIELSKQNARVQAEMAGLRKQAVYKASSRKHKN